MPDSKLQAQANIIGRKIFRVAEHQGVRPHRLVQHMVNHLGMNRSGLYRRLKGLAGWEEGELDQVAKLFKVDIATLLAESPSNHVPARAAPPRAATACTPTRPPAGQPVPATLAFAQGAAGFVELGTPAEGASRWFAVQAGLQLIVYAQGQEPPMAGPRLPVLRIILESNRPRSVAVAMPNQASVAPLLNSLAAEGLLAKHFDTPAEIYDSLLVNFDAYLFDWQQARHATCLTAVAQVRQRFPLTPIFIVAANIDRVGEDYLLRICEGHDARLVPKPFRPALVAREVHRAIDQAELLGRLLPV